MRMPKPAEWLQAVRTHCTQRMGLLAHANKFEVSGLRQLGDGCGGRGQCSFVASPVHCKRAGVGCEVTLGVLSGDAALQRNAARLDALLNETNLSSTSGTVNSREALPHATSTAAAPVR